MKIKELAMVAILATMVSCGSGASNTESEAATVDEVTEQTEENSVVIEADKAKVEEFIAVSSNGEIKAKGEKPVVIDFNATWCGPCRAFSPVFHQVASQMASRAVFLSVDTDKCPETAEAFGVTSIPNISVVHPDGTIDTHVGYMELEEFVEVLNKSLDK